MRENKYDQAAFFEKYAGMDRSVKGLEGAGEWHALRALLPDFTGKRVLDLGCGFGWHCMYAADQGAAEVIGIDLSEKMLAEARAKTRSDRVHYLCAAIEDYDYPASGFDVVLSSLAFHYVRDFDTLCGLLWRTLWPGGELVFSCEHPVFTAQGRQDWCYIDGKAAHWPVDRYFEEGQREAVFLGEPVIKYHRTVTGLIAPLLARGFTITGLVEPQPDPVLLDEVPGMRDELRRPMMLIVAARKPAPDNAREEVSR